MRESILTIPVNEVFEPKEGCPICRMRDTVEAHISEYIMGAAMMEPDVREETNRLGFCLPHYSMLAAQGNRLSLGLVLDTHLAETRKKFTAKLPKKGNSKNPADKSTCFVCLKVNWGIEHMLKTVFVLFEKDGGFKELFCEQEYFCLPHYNLLCAKSEQLPKKARAEFLAALNKVVSEYAKNLNKDVNEFCNSFDYRNAGRLNNPDMEKITTAPQRAIGFLTGREFGN